MVFQWLVLVVRGDRHRVTDVWAGQRKRICGGLHDVSCAAVTACDSIKYKAVGIDLDMDIRGMQSKI
jgi:hypothetical protein